MEAIYGHGSCFYLHFDGRAWDYYVQDCFGDLVPVTAPKTWWLE